MGFGWPRVDPVLDKIDKEIADLSAAIKDGGPTWLRDPSQGHQTSSGQLFAAGLCYHSARSDGVSWEMPANLTERNRQARFGEQASEGVKWEISGRLSSFF